MSRPSSARFIPKKIGQSRQTSRGASLGVEQTSKLNAVLQGIEDGHDLKKQVEYLDQLLDFCMGGSQVCLSIGSPSFFTIPVLIKCLRSKNIVLAIKAMDVLDFVVCKVRKNHKVFLSVPDSVMLLSFYLETMPECGSEGHLNFLQKVCALLLSLIRCNSAVKSNFFEAGGLRGLHGILTHVHSSIERAEALPQELSLLNVACRLITELASDTHNGQGLFVENGTLQVLCAFVKTALSNPSASESLEPVVDALCAFSKSWKNRQSMREHLLEVSSSHFASLESTDSPKYRPLLFLLLNLQHGDKDFQLPAYAESSVCKTFNKLCVCYESILDEVETIRQNHYDAELVAQSLSAIAYHVLASPLAKYIFTHTFGALDLLIQCINNIDQQIMEHACGATHALLVHNGEGQLDFLHRDGLSALCDCLQDYVIPIKRAALHTLSVLSFDVVDCRDELREFGVLNTILDMLKRYPADDVDLAVLDSCLALLSHVLINNTTNQEFVRSHGGLHVLVALLRQFVSESAGGAARACVWESLCSTLTNLTYRNASNQNDLLDLGALDICVPLLHHNTTPDMTLAALNILVNVTDTNPTAQTRVAAGLAAGGVMESLVGAEGAPRVRSMACLLLSHLAWNHASNQTLFASEHVMKQLLWLVQQAPRRVQPDATATEAPGGRPGCGGPVSPLLQDSPPMAGDCEVWPLVAGGAGSEAPCGAITRAARASVAPHHSLEHVAFYALVALVNLSYQNRVVQSLCGGLGGMEAIICCLHGNTYETRKSAAFCLGNLVRGHVENCERVAAAGGVAVLVNLLNDDDDDELSKCVFNTLATLEHAALRELLATIALILQDIGAQQGTSEMRPPTPDVTHTASLPDVCVAATTQPTHTASLTALAELDKYLPVLNGLIYVNSSNRDYMIRADGLALMLRLLSSAIPPHVAEYAAYLLANLTITRDRAMQNQARELGAFDVVSGYMSGPGRASCEVRCVLYTVMENLVVGNSANHAALASLPPLVAALVQDAQHAHDVALRTAAAHVLLHLYESDVCAKALVSAGAAAALHVLVTSPINVVLACKAQRFSTCQCAARGQQPCPHKFTAPPQALPPPASPSPAHQLL